MIIINMLETYLWVSSHWFRQHHTQPDLNIHSSNHDQRLHLLFLLDGFSFFWLCLFSQLVFTRPTLCNNLFQWRSPVVLLKKALCIPTETRLRHKAYPVVIEQGVWSIWLSIVSRTISVLSETDHAICQCVAHVS